MATLSLPNPVKLRLDPRWTVLITLSIYNLLGVTVLGFNRSPSQMIITIFSAFILQAIFNALFRLPMTNLISAVITGLGLCLLVNYGHNPLFAIFPIFLAISSKFIFTFNNRHVFNPGLMGVVLSILLTNEFISPAPAYQWNGIGSMSLFIAMPAILFIMPGINRTPLVLSFLVTYFLQITLRSLMIKHYLPWSTLVFGTITSPPFFLFTFFMLTDPSTSPSGKKKQITTGFLIGLIDLIYHLFSSYHTFFYATATLGSYKLLSLHLKDLYQSRDHLFSHLKKKVIDHGYYKRIIVIALMSLGGYSLYQYLFIPTQKKALTFHMHSIPHQQTSFHFSAGELMTSVDPRVQHMAKWILAITDGVATGDVNNDGLLDVFFTNAHKSKDDRGALFINRGQFKFERLLLGEEQIKFRDMVKYGIPANPYLVDIDGDGDLDLFVSYGFGLEGSSRLFRNNLIETNTLSFSEVTRELGLHHYSNSVTANFFDFNKDGRLDIITGNTIATHLPGYEQPTRLDLFHLPKPAYEGDRRMFDFMHSSWHMANNGGINEVFLQQEDGRFQLLDAKQLGLEATRWTMAIATADFNQDGWTDLYMANDFGPDDLYYNQQGQTFKSIKGSFFGTIGKDTYKGMNATIADFDHNGFQDVYISNVHHPLQAEGSLLWLFSDSGQAHAPDIDDAATQYGVLNENRFGWGAAAADFNNDGHIDLVQANGMVDDAYDKRHDQCPDYWYVNEKIARSPPSIHRYIDAWGDIRGMCIHGKEKNRLYLNRGDKHPKFTDVSRMAGLHQIGNWRGMAAADLDNDGRIDLIASSLFADPLVFHNKAKGKSEANWVGLDLVSLKEGCHRSAQGSKVTITYREKGQDHQRHFEKSLVNGFSAQSDRRLHIGLGAGILTGVTVNWCNGFEKTTYSNLQANRYHRLILE